MNLNLLRLVVALDETRHLSRAAEVLQMSQSGFSTALARLRTQFGDELFVRGGSGMRPTPKAISLALMAREVLRQVDQEVTGSTKFDPTIAKLNFKLSMSDVAEVVFMPKLVPYLTQHAPQSTVQITAPSGLPLSELLAEGCIDLAIGYFPDLEKDAYFRQPLISHSYACIAKKDHTKIKETLTLELFKNLGHVVVRSPAKSTSLLEQSFEQAKIQRRIILSTPNALSIPATVAKSDLIATLPIGTAFDATQQHQVQMYPLPFKAPTFRVYQYWHRRTHRDPSYQWLRSQIKILLSLN